MSRGDNAAVMGRRHADYEKGLDYYPTPQFATRAVCDFLAARHVIGGQVVREPAAGGGHMADVLAEYFGDVLASDCKEYGRYYERANYLTTPMPTTEWVITNPPFALAERFIVKALDEASVGVAMLCRLQFLETKGRYYGLFAERPPTDVMVFSSRLQFQEGRLATKDDTASAVAFACSFGISNGVAARGSIGLRRKAKKD